MSTTTDCGTSAVTPAGMACCGGQGCPACGDETPASLLALRARLGVREFLGASWTPPGFGVLPIGNTTADSPDIDDIQF